MSRVAGAKAAQADTAIRLLDLWRLRRGGWSLAFLIGTATLLAVVALLAISGWFITAAALAGVATTATLGFDYFRPAALIRLCAIVRTAGRYGERMASHSAALGLLSDLRCRIFEALTRRTLRAESRHADAVITMHRLVADIDHLDRFMLRMWMPWGWAGLMVLTVAGLLAWLDVSLLRIALPGLLLAWLGLPVLTWWQGSRLARQDAELAEQRRQALLEPLAALTSLLLWGRWETCRQRFAENDHRCLTHHERQLRLAGWVGALQQAVLGLSILAVVWQGFSLLEAGEISVPLLLAAVLGMLALGEILSPLANSFTSLGASLAARDRLNQLTTESYGPLSTSAEQPASPWHLELNRVTARWPNALAGPKEISLELHGGEILCLRGPSGCGKSTLLEVIAGEFEHQSGQLKLNGRDYRQWRLDDAIGYLPQQWDIFDMTLAQNLRLGDEQASDAELRDVLEDLALGEWVRAQPEGLDTRLGEYGAQVSGGQARRIALARLLLAGRPLLLLDEPLAGLDEQSRRQVLVGLRRRQGSGIMIIASHVPLTMPGAGVKELWLTSDGSAAEK
ncbi:thiol reductant ABC exporter subunit CydC [Billgrantia diversa]|uniref:thiol reductant ABC exporter subunit CydC n=1 Tax=Halomonas sp. MCCC 1A13316 TaxID=2733487 RepID=UPI0018A5D17D|nr:thiol reductant ABC exporter subunit CydC [Halomonas sp. MCCC 1A13316]QOR40406.1 thiol reductant ABC exporter subunit CydC [Halomonas sp. MCCC 1A13316]